MEDLSSLIWLGVVIVWFVARFIRRAARKAARKQTTEPRPTVSRPTTTRVPTSRSPFEGRPRFSDGGGEQPPPIVPH